MVIFFQPCEYNFITIKKTTLSEYYTHCERLKGAKQCLYYKQIVSATHSNDTYHPILRNSIVFRSL
jgi:hypothetical protein